MITISSIKSKSLILALVSVGVLAGCSSNADKEASANQDINPLNYVTLGDYEEVEVKDGGLEVYVGDRYVDIPYRDEECGSELTLQYYYTQVNPDEPKANWVDPSDEEIAGMGIPEVSTWNDLKNYVCDKVNENDEITIFMRVGDAIMEEIVEESVYEEIPEEVTIRCESIYAAYLEEMDSRYNEMKDVSFMQEDENSTKKVLAAMAIAQEAGIDKDGFDYEEVLKYLMDLQVSEE